jgi:hypothetical protein
VTSQDFSAEPAGLRNLCFTGLVYSIEPAVRENALPSQTDPSHTLLQENSDIFKLHFIFKVGASGWGGNHHTQNKLAWESLKICFMCLRAYTCL